MNDAGFHHLVPCFRRFYRIMRMTRGVAANVVNGDDCSVVAGKSLRVEDIFQRNIVLMPAIDENKVELQGRRSFGVVESMRNLLFVVGNCGRTVTRHESVPPREYGVNVSLRCENIGVLS